MIVIQIVILIVWMHFKSIQGLNYKIPNPCPVKLDSPVVDMCMSSIANEKDGNGPQYLDSVVLRAMVDRGDCTCDIVIENQAVQTGIVIEKYSNMSTAAPENNSCGLAIDFEMLNDESVYNSIECTSGVDRRPFSIEKNSVLRLTSRLIQGNFTRGYCMHIIRDDLTDRIPQRLRIVCNESVIFQHESSSISPIETKPETKDDDKLFVAIGICAGALVVIAMAIIHVVIFITRRRRSNMRPDSFQRNIVQVTNAENDDAQYDGLKDNVLYVSARQHQDIDINYSTVDLERSQITARHSEIDTHYNTVECNVETRSLQTLQTFHDNEAITNNETSQFSNQTLNPPNACSVVYAVVDKGLRNPIHSSSTNIQDDANPHQAYAIVDKTRNQDP